MYIALLVFHVIGLLFCVGLFLYVLTKNPSRAGRFLLVMLFCTVVTLASYLCEMTATTVEAGLTAVKIGYLTKPFILLATICFVAEYAKIRLPKWAIIALFLFGSLVTGLVFTNDYHHLYYKTLYMEKGLG